MKSVLPLDVTNYNIERSSIISIFTYKLTKLSRKFLHSMETINNMAPIFAAD